MFKYWMFKCEVGNMIKKVVVREINEIKARWALCEYIRETYPGHEFSIQCIN